MFFIIEKCVVEVLVEMDIGSIRECSRSCGNLKSDFLTFEITILKKINKR